MTKITIEDMLNNCDAKLLIGSKDTVINECFINSKEVTRGACFFGIKGEKTDGSLFYKEAFNNGADICVLSKIKDLDLKGYDDKTVIISSDPKSVLQSLAMYKRSLFEGKVIGITGSVGKTSTKELLANVLEKKYKVLKTIGNQNSQLGLPLTILRLKDEDVMILEMGMSNLGEMHNLSIIAKPDIAVITNVYDSHIENLGSRENILKAKLEIIDGMNFGTLIINNDNDMLNRINICNMNNVNIITYGINNDSNFKAKNIFEGYTTTFDVSDIEGIEVLGGEAFIYNVLASVIVGKLMNVENDDIKNAINNGVKIKRHLECVKLDNDTTLIDDAYNASYESVKAALKYISKFSGRKIIVLGDILELGKSSKSIHKKIGNEVINNDIDYLITIGKYSKYINKQASKKIKRKNIKHFKNEYRARKYIKDLLMENDTILVKGSNKMNLINLIEYLKKKD